ncbi:hypothetical protein LPJ66_000919 [Kickxella alabastrina]|uniref:Uncharacterized protein n=1 Tax=Kickxella alabastrina TaxID=61397 RepID=A0ACC1IUM8_9FUNG|nr:hypothetical protein LPJ66_000919 [Kickxella alabastrina]
MKNHYTHSARNQARPADSKGHLPGFGPAGLTRFPEIEDVCETIEGKRAYCQQTFATTVRFAQLVDVTLGKVGMAYKLGNASTGKAMDYQTCAHIIYGVMREKRGDLGSDLDDFSKLEAMAAFMFDMVNRCEVYYPGTITVSRLSGRSDGHLLYMASGSYDTIKRLALMHVADNGPRLLDPLNDIAQTPLTLTNAELQQVGKDIDELEKQSQPSARNTREVENVINIINSLAIKKFPSNRVRVSLFGSRVYGMCSNSSDLDISVTAELDTIDYDTALVRFLNQVARMIGRVRGFSHVVKITRTRVPIIKFTYMTPSGTRLDGDISINNNMGVAKTDMIAQYIRMDPRVRRVLLVLKQWGARREIPNYNVMNSYSLMMMGITFLINQGVVPPLQMLSTTEVTDKTWRNLDAIHSSSSLVNSLYQCSRPNVTEHLNLLTANGVRCLETNTILPDCPVDGMRAYFYSDTKAAQSWQSKNTDSVPLLIYKMFQYYGCKFDPMANVISPRLGSAEIPRAYLPQLKASSPNLYLSQRQKWRKDLRLLVIEDPFELALNCGRNAGPEWVECFLWEMRRAAWAMLPKKKGKNYGSIRRMMLPPSRDIYETAEMWALTFRILKDELHIYLKAGNAEAIKELYGDPIIDLEVMENAQMDADSTPANRCFTLNRY